MAIPRRGGRTEPKSVGTDVWQDVRLRAHQRGQFHCLAYVAASRNLLDEENPPRVLVLDSGIADAEFGEALRELKSDRDTRRTPILALIGRAEDTDTFRQRACGKDCFLRKPFNPMELVALVRRILQDHDNYSGGAPARGSRI